MPARRLLTTTVCVFLGLVGLAASVPRQDSVRMAPERLSTVIGVWTPGAAPLSVEEVGGRRSRLGPSDRELISSALDGGLVRIHGGSVSTVIGRPAPRARLIVLFSPSSTLDARLPLPDALNGLYVETPGGWMLYPKHTAVLPETIAFLGMRRPGRMEYKVEGPDQDSIFVDVPADEMSAPSSKPAAPPAASPVPRKTKHVAPVYPDSARRAGIVGSVLLNIAVSQSGKVTSAKVLRSQPMLDQAAIDCVLQWEYAPMPTPVRQMTVSVDFVP